VPYAEGMSKPENFSLVVSPNHNGLVLVTLITGTGVRRRMVLRTHLTYDVADAYPSHQRILADAAAHVAGLLARS